MNSNPQSVMSDPDAPGLTQEPPRENLPAVVTDEADGVIARWETAGARIITNISNPTPADNVMIINALSVTDARTRDVVGQELPLIGYVAHTVEIVNKQTGEVSTLMRVVMILADGRLISTMSKGVVRTLGYLSKVNPTKKWTPPLMVKIESHPLPEGQSYCTLKQILPLIDIEEPKKKK